MRLRERAPWVALAAVVAVGLGTVVASMATSGDGDEPTRGRIETAEVVRTDLVRTEELAGTLGFAEPDPVVAHRSGVVTWLPAAGAVVAVGEPLYRVDQQPTVLLSGEVAAYRPLGPGVGPGADVRQLEESLIALGHLSAGTEPDDQLDGATVEGIERLQSTLGEPVTGRLALGTYAFRPGAQRIVARSVPVGAVVAPGSLVLTAAADRRVVTVDLDARDGDLVSAGDQAEVELPDGSTVPATVTSVAAVATVPPAPPGGSSPPATLDVVLELDAEADVGFDRAPVTVRVAAARADDVLAVPVRALLALAEGGYAVEVVDRGRADGGAPATRLVGVELGAFAGSLVEVRGDVAPGDRVVVAGR